MIVPPKSSHEWWLVLSVVLVGSLAIITLAQPTTNQAAATATAVITIISVLSASAQYKTGNRYYGLLISLFIFALGSTLLALDGFPIIPGDRKTWVIPSATGWFAVLGHIFQAGLTRTPEHSSTQP